MSSKLAVLVMLGQLSRVQSFEIDDPRPHKEFVAEEDTDQVDYNDPDLFVSLPKVDSGLESVLNSLSSYGIGMTGQDRENELAQI